MMKRLMGFAVLMGLMVTVAVGQESAGPVTNPYFPMKKDSVWEYDVAGGPITVKIVGTEVIKGVTCYKFETTAGGKPAASETVGITKEGVQRYAVNGINAETPILFLKADAKAGDKWTVESKVSNQTVKGTFVAKEEKIKVGDKDYDTLHVKAEDMEIGTTKTGVEYWFAKDVGIVKLKFSLGSQDATLTLKNYTPGK